MRNRPDVCIVSCMSSNFVIGNENKIPWSLKPDMQRFVELTAGHPIIMGRRTWESIGSKPLPNRQNIVVSKTAKTIYGALTVSSINTAIDMFSGFPKIMIIGGASIYEESSGIATSAELTVIGQTYFGDTLFPHWAFTKKSGWDTVSAQSHAAKDNTPAYTFIQLKRIHNGQ